MAQPILKRQLNPFLLISTIAALSLLAGVAVISQDQISKKETQVNTLQDDNSDLSTEINRLESEVQNTSLRLERVKRNNTRLQNSIETLEGNLSSREERIVDLQNQLEQAQQNEEQSDLVESLNTSLGIMCSQVSASDVSINRCDDHGHSLGG